MFKKILFSLVLALVCSQAVAKRTVVDPGETVLIRCEGQGDQEPGQWALTVSFRQIDAPIGRVYKNGGLVSFYISGGGYSQAMGCGFDEVNFNASRAFPGEYLAHCASPMSPDSYMAEIKPDMTANIFHFAENNRRVATNIPCRQISPYSALHGR